MVFFIILLIDLLSVLAFIKISWQFKPDTIRYQIEFKRLDWESIFEELKILNANNNPKKTEQKESNS
jgi:hypothetical protein